MTKLLRQGDVGLIPIAAPTPNADRVLVPEKRKLIRKGENGGVHELESLKNATIYSEVSLDERNKTVFMRCIEVKEPTRIVHSEHAPIDLVPGWYEIRIQREFFENTVRYTAD